MATELTKTAQLLSEKTNPEPQMIVEIDGITEVFGALPVTEVVKIGAIGLEIGNFKIGGVVEKPESRDWIDLKNSTKSLSQQISNDGTGLSSVQSIKVKILDVNERLSAIFSPGVVVGDILTRQANVYLSFVGGAHPNDSVKIMSGLIDEIVFGAGFAVISIAHPEQIKRQKILRKIDAVSVNRIDYNSITVQDLFMRRRNQLRDLLSIEYLDTTTAGNETASINPTTFLITVNIESGVSTAQDVETALRNDPYVSSVLDVEITGTKSNPQTAISATNFLKDTTITLDTTEGLVEPQSILRSYIRIEDEIMEYTGISGNDLTGVVRGQLNTLPVFHEPDEDAESFYRMIDEPIDMALKVMLSNGGTAFKSGVAVERFNQVDPATFIQNAIYFKSADIESELGLVQGDLITITLATEGANNVADRQIASFGTIPSGSYIVLAGTDIVTEIDSAAVAAFKSKYNTLPKEAGFGMSPIFVDVPRHESIRETFSANFPTYDYYIKDEIEGTDFINKDIYLPINLFAIPRIGKSSLNIIKPPLTDADTKLINEDSVVGPDRIRLKRSINNQFYNAITYRYEQGSIDDDFFAGVAIDSESSQEIIDAGIRPLTIDAPGIRREEKTDTLLRNNALKQILRFRFGAENMVVQVLYRAGFNLDVGDTVIFDGEALKITDTTLGKRGLLPRLMEIGNKEMDFESGNIKLTLIDTAFNLDGRFGTIGPASKVDTGATTTNVPIKRSFGTNELTQENAKWQSFIGENIRVRSPDLTFDEEVKLVRFLPTQENVIEVDPPLSSAPLENYVVDMPVYDPSDTASNRLWKTIHCYATPQVDVTSGTSTTQFDVGAGDIGKFFVGGFIRIHNDDFSRDSGDTSIVDITGTTITSKGDLGFTPAVGDRVELIGFGDKGKPYRII